ncbi:hypothetical protein VNO77_26666 [Canavalia gladiata]|uniref:Uncharacterized protein n=1 Tax=Canavalia gladiata TaxID=3824 RepID=A0AAN9KT72_CANGL
MLIVQSIVPRQKVEIDQPLLQDPWLDNQLKNFKGPKPVKNILSSEPTTPSYETDLKIRDFILGILVRLVKGPYPYIRMLARSRDQDGLGDYKQM